MRVLLLKRFTEDDIFELSPSIELATMSVGAYQVLKGGHPRLPKAIRNEMSCRH